MDWTGCPIFANMPRKDIHESLKNLVLLLHQEREEDLRQYQTRMIGTSLKERRKQGVCWYPVSLDRTKFDAGERLLVKVTQPPEHTDPHLFTSGKMVTLFSNAAGLGDHEDSVGGVVNQVNKFEMIITINVDDVPQWVHHGQLGVQLMFDENAYREMEKSLHTLIKTKDDRINELKHILLGGKEPVFHQLHQQKAPGLNESQNRALNQVLNAQDVAIIHGPPGTGKTTTIIQAIVETVREEHQVLVCAPSNAAVDLLAERLGEQNIEVLRIGHPARVTDSILEKTLDAKIAHHKDYKDLKDLRKKADEYFRLAGQYKRSFGKSEREQRQFLKKEAHALKDQANQLKYYITNDVLAKTQVIACTLIGANHLTIKGMTFKTTFIDEAAQALEPACWIPIMKADRVIFAGDHCQLPPTIKSFDAAKNGLEVTLFEKAIEHNQADVMLREQYRMNEKIMDFSSRSFYKGGLIANEQVKHWTVTPEDLPVEFIDTAGTGFQESVDRETRSSFNAEEAEILLRHLRHYLLQVDQLGKLEDIKNIGIISPYKAQTNLINELFQDAFDEELMGRMAINTVDSFQGQERDVIYISLVRSNDKGEIGFLKDTRRMNVAITRARKKLVVIGDSATIGQHPFYEGFLDYVNEIDAYRSAFELVE